MAFLASVLEKITNSVFGDAEISYLNYLSGTLSYDKNLVIKNINDKTTKNIKRMKAFIRGMKDKQQQVFVNAS